MDCLLSAGVGVVKPLVRPALRELGSGVGNIVKFEVVVGQGGQDVSLVRQWYTPLLIALKQSGVWELPELRYLISQLGFTS